MILSKKGSVYVLSFILAITSGLVRGNKVEAQSTKYINGRQFVEETGEWYRVYQGDKFKVQERVITVKLKTDVSLQKLRDETNTRGVEFVRKNSLGYMDLRIPKSKTPLSVVESYTKSGLVQTAEANTYGRLDGDDRGPNDPKFGNDKQWYLEHSDGPDIQATWAWHLDTGEPASVIAMLDTGTDIDHEDLSKAKDTSATGNIWMNPGEGDWSKWYKPSSGNKYDDDSNGKEDDWKGWDFIDNDNNVYNNTGAMGSNHGTWVAGIAAALTHNDAGVAGVAGGWEKYEGSAIMPIRVTEPVDNVSTPKTSIIDEAIEYAAMEGADVINMSFTVAPNSAMDAAIKEAHQKYGVFLVSSAGDNPDGGNCEITYPANNQYVLSVGSTEMTDTYTDKTCLGYEQVLAPGKNIFNTDTSDAYIEANGTSASSAIVAGLAGLIHSVKPGVAPDSVYNAIASTCKDLGDAGQDDIYGYGRIRTQKALKHTLENYGGDLGGPHNANIRQEVTFWNGFERLDIQSDDTVAINESTLLRFVGKTNVFVDGKLRVDKNSVVLMDTDNNIKVNDGGQMISAGDSAKPVRFGLCGTCGSGSWKKIKFRKGANGNRFDYTVITGGYKSVEINSKNNTLYKTRIKNGWRGISGGPASSGNAEVTLKHVIIENHSSVGVVAYYTDPAFDHVTVRNNNQAGVWFSSADTDIFYKSLIDSNAVNDNTRAGIELHSGSGVTMYGLDGYDDRGYTRVQENVGDEILIQSAAHFVMGIENNEALAGGYNAIYPNPDGNDITCNEASSFDIYAEYVYWGGDMPKYSGDCNIYISPMLDNDDSAIGPGASGVPGSSSSSSSAPPTKYPELVTATASPSATNAEHTQSSNVKLLAEVEDPFALARQGGAAVGVQRKQLPVAKADEIASRMQTLQQALQSDTTDKPARWLHELYIWHLHDESGQTGELDNNRKLFTDYSNKLTEGSTLSPAMQQAAEMAAILTVQDHKIQRALVEANDLIEKFEAEVSVATRADLLMERVGIQALHGEYAKAQNTLEKVKELKGDGTQYPTLSEILAEGAAVSSDGTEATAMEEAQGAPTRFTLNPAYPNPFNPTTTVPFTLADRADVRIELYNMLGRHVATLTDQSYQTGRHSLQLNGGNLSSGLYIIQVHMQTQEGHVKQFNQKVTLIK